MSKVSDDPLRSRRTLGGFKEQLRQLSIEVAIVEKRNDKLGNVDPRLISEAYRLLFIEKKAPSDLILASSDEDHESLLLDYERQGRKGAVCSYQPVGGGASIYRRAVRLYQVVCASTRLFGQIPCHC
jgi:hypothetical protein